MDEDRKTNNSMWIVEEYTEWLNKAIDSVKTFTRNVTALTKVDCISS